VHRGFPWPAGCLGPGGAVIHARVCVTTAAAAAAAMCPRVSPLCCGVTAHGLLGVDHCRQQVAHEPPPLCKAGQQQPSQGLPHNTSRKAAHHCHNTCIWLCMSAVHGLLASAVLAVTAGEHIGDPLAEVLTWQGTKVGCLVGQGTWRALHNVPNPTGTGRCARRWEFWAGCNAVPGAGSTRVFATTVTATFSQGCLGGNKRLQVCLWGGTRAGVCRGCCSMAHRVRSTWCAVRS
jgi:hypothetical protein